MSRHEATVRLLPNHWWDSSWATSRTLSQSSVEEVRAERRQALRLERDLELVVGDHGGVARERVRAEEPLEQRHHLGLPTEGVRTGGRAADWGSTTLIGTDDSRRRST